MSDAAPTPVRLWIDPSCPWAWQALRWLRDLRDRDVIDLTYAFFSLEINAHAFERNDVDPGLPYVEAAPRWGEALEALAQARNDGGDEAVGALLVALGRRHHDAKEPAGPELVEAACAETRVKLPGAAGRPKLQRQILDEYAAGRALDVFGVPTLQIGDDAVVYGPIIAVGPTGPDGEQLWQQIKGVADRPGFFELKRWPRTLRPGEEPVGT